MANMARLTLLLFLLSYWYALTGHKPCGKIGVHITHEITNALAIIPVRQNLSF